MLRQSVSWWLMFLIGIWLVPFAALGFIDPTPVGATLPNLNPAPVLQAGTTISVTTAVDELNVDGDCSLREALAAANLDTAVDACPAGSGADIVQLQALRYTLTLTETEDVTGGDWDITSTLTLQGITTTLTMLDAAQVDRVLHIHAGANAVVKDLTLTNGLTLLGPATGCGSEGDLPCPSEPGGGVYNEGTLLLTQVVVRNNRTAHGFDLGFCPSTELCEYSIVSGGDGGGVYNRGKLTMVNATVADNAAGDGGDCDTSCDGGNGGNGGGIFNQGVVTLTQAVIQNNRAGTGGDSSSIRTVAGSGGGIFNAGTMTADLVTVTLSLGGKGGAYYQPGGPPYCQPERLPSSFGGGIANHGRLTIVRSTIASNASSTDFDSGVDPSAGGGGIGNAGILIIEQTTVANNSTPGGSGGSGASYRCAAVAGSGTRGGGIYNHSILTMTNSTLFGNVTGGGGGAGVSSGPGNGGDGAGIFNTGKVWLNNTTLFGNQTGAGGDGDRIEPGRAGHGGGIVIGAGTVHIQNSVIATNTGSATGGDCYGVLTSHGHSLLVDLRGCTLKGDVDGNVIGFDPRLEPFGDHGGPTWTLPPLPSSPAVDGGTCLDWSGVPIAVDQRGEPRPQGETCDIGAVESPYTSTFVIHDVALPLIAGDTPLAPKSR